MIDAIIDALKFDEFIFALAGHIASEASAQVTFSAVKSIGAALFGLALGPREIAVSAARKSRRRAKRRQALNPPNTRLSHRNGKNRKKRGSGSH